MKHQNEVVAPSVDSPAEVQPTLAYGRNQCPSCGQLFKSEAGFDKHRVGSFADPDNPRQCLSEAEMLSKGMVKDGAGLWITRRRLFAALPNGVEDADERPDTGSGIDSTEEPEMLAFEDVVAADEGCSEVTS